jgi:hypothetical protein
MLRVWLSAAAMLCVVLAAEAHDPITTRVTWNGEIARIFQARCASCHSATNPKQIPLTTYEEARPWARAIKEEVTSRRMPIWHAVRGYGDFANDPSLSAFEIALVSAWADGGAPRGVAAPPAAKAPPSSISTATSLTTGLTTGLTTARHNVTEVTLPCRDQPAFAGTLLAVTPVLEKDGEVGIAAGMPDGTRQIVAWIRGASPEFPTTYWLRSPLRLSRQAKLLVQAQGSCEIRMTLAARR